MRLLVLFAFACLAAPVIAPAGAQQPNGMQSLFDIANKAQGVVANFLNAPRSAAELQKDEALFTLRFRVNEQQRGRVWTEFAKIGKPVEPKAFQANCRVSLNALAAQRAMLEAAERSQKGPVNRTCQTPITCTAVTTRETGCYKIDLDACGSDKDEIRIDRITNMTRYVDGKVITSPCTKQKEKQPS